MILSISILYSALILTYYKVTIVLHQNQFDHKYIVRFDNTQLTHS